MSPTLYLSEVFTVQEDRYGAHNYHPLDVVCTRGAGVYLDSYDLQSAGLGMVAFGAGRMVEDYTAQSLADAAKK